MTNDRLLIICALVPKFIVGKVLQSSKNASRWTQKVNCTTLQISKCCPIGWNFFPFFSFLNNEGIPMIFYLTRLIPPDKRAPTYIRSWQSKWKELNARPWRSEQIKVLCQWLITLVKSEILQVEFINAQKPMIIPKFKILEQLENSTIQRTCFNS